MFPETPAGTKFVFGRCPDGYDGVPVKDCGLQTAWSDNDSSEPCVRTCAFGRTVTRGGAVGIQFGTPLRLSRLVGI